jgi:hypothetical protein
MFIFGFRLFKSTYSNMQREVTCLWYLGSMPLGLETHLNIPLSALDSFGSGWSLVANLLNMELNISIP